MYPPSLWYRRRLQKYNWCVLFLNPLKTLIINEILGSYECKCQQGYSNTRNSGFVSVNGTTCSGMPRIIIILIAF